MPGLIRREDVEEVRERTRIDDVIREYVTLKSAGVGSLTGLCPFHDERTPSFNVRPQVGRYHCFGCGESGDVYAFLMGMDHLSFTEAVERLAARLNYQLRYEEGSASDRAEVGERRRILDANAQAETWFRSQLTTQQAQIGRVFLSERGFDRAAAEAFGVGFALNGWDGLTNHLRAKGFQDDILTKAGLVSAGNRGVYDRFRGRLIWPIRDITGATVGFGARRLLEDDNGPKYLNTPHTTVYNKSQVLYGLDLAKREIAKNHQVVIVEGYTDVMAMHLAGVTRAVATCGTAFGVDHIKVLRRLLGDDDTAGEVVFTFDGDEAGRNAALKAFKDAQRFVAQTYVAVAPGGMDPCDLRLAQGDDAVRRLLDGKQLLFEFVLRSAIADFDLAQPEGRVFAMRAGSRLIADIKDPALRREHARQLSGWIGMELREVERAVSDLVRSQRSQSQPSNRRPPSQAPPAPEPGPAPIVVNHRGPVTRAEAQALGLALQYPTAAKAAGMDELDADAFGQPAHQALWFALVASWDQLAADGPGWLKEVESNTPDSLRPLLSALAVADLPLRPGESADPLAARLVLDARRRQLLRQEADLRTQAQVLEGRGDAAGAATAFQQAFDLAKQRKSLGE